jgi:antitoxin YefM
MTISLTGSSVREIGRQRRPLRQWTLNRSFEIRRARVVSGMRQAGCEHWRLETLPVALNFDYSRAVVGFRERRRVLSARCPPLSALASATGSTYSFLYVNLEWRAMKTMTYSESRARYAEVLNSVNDDREEVVITRAGHDPVVIVSLEDYESLKETAYLLRSPANARRLLASIEELENGGGTVRDLTPAE